MNRTLRLADALWRYQRRHRLTMAELAAVLVIPEERIGYLQRWSIVNLTDRPCLVDQIAERYLCDAEALAVILLEAVESTHA